MKIAIIGGGASGVFCSIVAKNSKNQVVIFEKNEKLMKKLFITGKGRCNLTNDCEKEEFFSAVMRNPKFMISAYEGLSSQDLMAKFQSFGLSLKVERGNRVFPSSDKSSDVLKVLEREVKNAGVEVRLSQNVVAISKNDEKFIVRTDSTKEEFDAVVVATGGVTYPATGSTGDGYRFAQMFGVATKDRHVSLCGLKTNGGNVEYAGLSLKNVVLRVKNKKNKVEFSQMGEMLFTHTGVSGPLVLTASSLFSGKDLKEYEFCVDLKPALDEETLDARVRADFDKFAGRALKNSLSELLPQKLIPRVISACGVDGEKKVNEVNKKERKALCTVLKNMPLYVCGFEALEGGIITNGGVATKEVSPKTMLCKKVDGLYFIGEVLDVDCVTGGFNLQVAFATANACGTALCEMEE